MISAKRVKRLRCENCLYRLEAKRRFYAEIFVGQHAATISGMMIWVESHPDKSIDDFVMRRQKTIARAVFCLKTIDARIDRVKSILKENS